MVAHTNVRARQTGAFPSPQVHALGLLEDAPAPSGSPNQGSKILSPLDMIWKRGALRHPMP